MLFSLCCDARDLRPSDDASAHRSARDVTERFASAFPDVEIDVRWQSENLNAQAYRLGERRCIVLFGGLVRHVGLGVEGLAVAVAHEMGHHEAGPPYHRFYPWLSSERRADEWAFAVGLPRLFGREAAQIASKGALQLLQLLHDASLAQSAPAGECQVDQPCLACRAAILHCDLGLRCTANPKDAGSPSCT